MSENLDAKIAQRLFGWTYAARAYTTDPVATAEVWQWVETRERLLTHIAFSYYGDEARGDVMCTLTLNARDEGTTLLTVEGPSGATWPEALCRAALALAAALAEETA